jgi:L-rhamnose-H+ transport protein
MTEPVWFGIALTLFAGVLSGTCMLPMKFARGWAWENTWLVFSVVSLCVLPWSLALILVQDLPRVYSALPVSQIALPLLLGAGWGIAQVLFGISISRLGMALGYAIIVGLGALLGTLVPLFVGNRSVLGTGRGTFIVGGLAVMVLGIVVSARAGHLRNRSGSGHAERGSYLSALTLAILCGLMAPMLNYAFVFGQPIADEAVRVGSSQQSAGYTVWPIALTGGLLPNVAYSVYRLQRNHTWKHFRGFWLLKAWPSGLMGLLWMGAFAIYGVGSVYLGDLGTSVGWALFQIFMILTANVSGVFVGEWNFAPPSARRTLWIGLTLLAIATSVVAASNA